MEKKIVLITGASDGVGKETAKTLAKLGDTIIMHGRNPEKTRLACEEVKKYSGNKDVHYYIADFLSMAQIRDFAEKINKDYPRLDILINNAGAQFTDKRELTVDGHEKTMEINLIAPFLLTWLLMPLLRKSRSARVITVSSEAHRMAGKPRLEDIELKNGYSMARAYGLSKLYVIWMMRYFAKYARREGINNVTFNLVHPASATTQLGRESTKEWKARIIYWLWRPMMKTAAQGASSSVYAATSPSVEGVSGKYIGLKGEQKSWDKYDTESNEKAVWDYCLKATEDYR